MAMDLELATSGKELNLFHVCKNVMCEIKSLTQRISKPEPHSWATEKELKINISSAHQYMYSKWSATWMHEWAHGIYTNKSRIISEFFNSAQSVKSLFPIFLRLQFTFASLLCT